MSTDKIMSTEEIANIAANFEKDFAYLSEHPSSNEPNSNDEKTPYTINIDGETYTFKILDTCSITDNYGVERYKAVVLQDQYGNIYIHYNGTGKGNWEYNAVAYGGDASYVQEESLDFFNYVMQKYQPNCTGKIYVSGHSQGGNNAQYALMMSPYGVYVEECIALDAPGFSEEAVERMKALYGEDYYNSQREKIHAYNGDRDYVHELGQVNIIPHDHITIIETGDTDFMYSHLVNGMMDGNSLKPKAEPQEYESYAVIAAYLNNKIIHLPDEDQRRIADLVMKAVEFFIGNEETPLTGEEWHNLVTLLAPVLVEVMIADMAKVDAAMLSISGCAPLVSHIYFQIKACALGTLALVDLINHLVLLFNDASNFIFNLTIGAKYSDLNPYMKADPLDLEKLATRLRNINSRLVSLDGDLNDLYWQVGLLDILDILNANLITGYSFRISAAATFLDNAAEMLMNADSAVKGYIGG